MILEMGMDWMRLPWVITVEILIGRMRSNAAQEDNSNSRDLEESETTAARDKLQEWLSDGPKSVEQILIDEDDALLRSLGVSRPAVASND